MTANQGSERMAIVKSKLSANSREAYIAYMFCFYLHAPGRETLPGEPVDLGEIGHVKEKDWERQTPNSPAEPSK